MTETLSSKTNKTENNGATAPEPAACPGNRRLERINDYQEESLASSSPLAANLGAVNSDLMRLSWRLMEATDQALARSPKPIAEFAMLRGPMEMCSQLARQIQRLSELDNRLRATKGSSPGSESLDR